MPTEASRTFSLDAALVLACRSKLYEAREHDIDGPPHQPHQLNRYRVLYAKLEAGSLPELRRGDGYSSPSNVMLAPATDLDGLLADRDDGW
jgi:hypothetical protein